MKAVQEFGSYIDANQDFIPNYGDRYRHDETISAAFVESTVNYVVSKRFVKKQQMRWTQRGAHLLLQTRTQVLNDDLRKKPFANGSANEASVRSAKAGDWTRRTSRFAARTGIGIARLGNTVDFLLTAKRDCRAAQRFFTRAVKNNRLPKIVN